MPQAIGRRRFFGAALAAAAALVFPAAAGAASFSQWVEGFRPRARARGRKASTHCEKDAALAPLGLARAAAAPSEALRNLRRPIASGIAPQSIRVQSFARST